MKKKMISTYKKLLNVNGIIFSNSFVIIPINC